MLFKAALRWLYLLFHILTNTLTTPSKVLNKNLQYTDKYSPLIFITDIKTLHLDSLLIKNVKWESNSHKKNLKR